jgi:hypothetical protein
MTMADDVNLEEFVVTKDEFSGADIKGICTEAGLLALHVRRTKVILVCILQLTNRAFCVGWKIVSSCEEVCKFFWSFFNTAWLTMFFCCN